MHPIQTLIEESFEKRADITPATASPELKSAVMQVIDELEKAKLRLAALLVSSRDVYVDLEH